MKTIYRIKDTSRFVINRDTVHEYFQYARETQRKWRYTEYRALIVKYIWDRRGVVRIEFRPRCQNGAGNYMEEYLIPPYDIDKRTEATPTYVPAVYGLE